MVFDRKVGGRSQVCPDERSQARDRGHIAERPSLEDGGVGEWLDGLREAKAEAADLKGREARWVRGCISAKAALADLVSLYLGIRERRLALLGGLGGWRRGHGRGGGVMVLVEELERVEQRSCPELCVTASRVRGGIG